MTEAHDFLRSLLRAKEKFRTTLIEDAIINNDQKFVARLRLDRTNTADRKVLDQLEYLNGRAGYEATGRRAAIRRHLYKFTAALTAGDIPSMPPCAVSFKALAPR
jgi:hypothetical protein